MVKFLLFIVFFINVMVLPMTHLSVRELHNEAETVFLFHHNENEQHSGQHVHTGADCCTHSHCGVNYFLPDVEKPFLLITFKSFYNYFDISYTSYLNFFIEHPPKA